MKKVLLFSLILALVGMTILPAVAVPKSAEAGLFDATITCDPVELNFIHYTGVPETLLGFIPLETQKVTVTSDKFWSASDNADWITLLATVFPGEGELTVWLNNNVDDLEAGTYTATITVTASGLFASASATIDVTLEVIEPKVMGPLGIGMLNIFDTSTENYGGFVVNLLTNPDDAMDMQAIETDGCFNLMIQRGEEIPGLGIAITGNLSIQGETIQVMAGGILPFSALMTMMPGAELPIPEDFDWGDNRALMMQTSNGIYIGLLLSDLETLLNGIPDLLPLLEGMLAVEAPAATNVDGLPGVISNTGNTTGNPTANADMVIPMSPILGLLPTLMPVMIDLLSNESLLSILAPLMGMLPPIMIVVPMDVIIELFMGLM